MKEEIFGPILPIISYKTMDEVILKIQTGNKPLAVYYAGSSSSKNFKRLMNETSSGSINCNDTIMQPAEIECGFGGVGFSGYGRVGGYESFKQFSNQKCVTIKQPIYMWPSSIFCAPWTSDKVATIRMLVKTTGVKQWATLRKLLKLFVLFLIWLFFCTEKFKKFRI